LNNINERIDECVSDYQNSKRRRDSKIMKQ